MLPNGLREGIPAPPTGLNPLQYRLGGLLVKVSQLPLQGLQPEDLLTLLALLSLAGLQVVHCPLNGHPFPGGEGAQDHLGDRPAQHVPLELNEVGREGLVPFHGRLPVRPEGMGQVPRHLALQGRELPVGFGIQPSALSGLS